jgi:hypothetical protein
VFLVVTVDMPDYSRSGGNSPGPKIKKMGCKRAPPILGPFWGQLGLQRYSFLILSLGPFWVSCFPLLNFEFELSCLLSYRPPRHNSFFSFTRNRAISPKGVVRCVEVKERVMGT